MSPSLFRCLSQGSNAGSCRRLYPITATMRECIVCISTPALAEQRKRVILLEMFFEDSHVSFVCRQAIVGYDVSIGKVGTDSKQPVHLNWQRCALRLKCGQQHFEREEFPYPSTAVCIPFKSAHPKFAVDPVICKHHHHTGGTHDLFEGIPMQLSKRGNTSPVTHYDHAEPRACQV